MHYDDYDDYTAADARADDAADKLADQINSTISKLVKWIESNIEAFGDWGYLGHVTMWDKEWSLLHEELEMQWDPEYGYDGDTKDMFEMWVRLLAEKGIYPMDEDGVRAEEAPPMPNI